MEIEPSPFDFQSLGLPTDFLEQNAIDRDFFYSLTDELRMEILMDYMPANPQPVQQESRT